MYCAKYSIDTGGINMDTQMKRGVLDVCVLTALMKEDSYGYKIIKDLKDVIEISESTLYPILRRLEKNGYLSVYTQEHNFRLRKMYSITEKGLERINEYLEDLEELMKIYRYIQKETGND